MLKRGICSIVGSLRTHGGRRHQHLEVLKALPFTVISLPLPLPLWVLHAVPPSPDKF